MQISFPYAFFTAGNHLESSPVSVVDLLNLLNVSSK